MPFLTKFHQINFLISSIKFCYVFKEEHSHWGAIMAWQNFWPVSPGLENRIYHELACVTVFSILFAFRAVFIQVSKSDWFCINYASRLAENNLHLFFIQSEVNLKLIVTHACRSTVHVITLSFIVSLLVLSMSFVIG